MKQKKFDITIVGGGASGALTAIRILRSGFTGSLALISRESNIGRGAAYGTDDPHHLLNVIAGKMSLFPEEPDHFVRWLTANGHHGEELQATFQPRMVYGDYLVDTFATAVERTKGLFEVVQDDAVCLESTGEQLRVSLRDQGSMETSQLVLALGHLPSKAPRPYGALVGHPRWIGNLWKPSAVKSVGKDDTVLIVGTGLTMIDVVLSLKAQGHQGTIFARSRRGLIPQSHGPTLCFQTPEEVDVASLIRKCRDEAPHWRGVIDSMRPITQKIWASLCWDEKRRLLHRLMAYWDVHRHRMPPSVANLIENLRESGMLDIRAGSARSAQATSDGFKVDFGSETLTADWIVNCTGPCCDWACAKTPLLESAVQHGLLSYDPLGMGVLVDSDGRVGPTSRIWALGPICRGCRLETVAMPEIRVQAQELARLLVAG